MEIRLAFPNELSQIMTVINSAKAALAQSGSSQWQKADGYPAYQDIAADVLQGQGYVALLEGQIVAYAAVIDGQEDAYDKIYDGRWQHNHHRYVTFHRVAVLSDRTGQGIAQTFLQGLIEGQHGPDFRIDTHEHNQVMRHIIEKLGFVYCGKVPIDGERLAYQKIKKSHERAAYQEISEDSRYSY
ncbi:TPA: GNAT family N-acetyltransferase [Streptococcus equi subsp. zooepidemicus]|uniref:GNAT family N-acetyltransferase n=1 Tax=Streptococcus equi TaxID=1336 RepID=UPI0013F60F80|nr:GNAT family N-acetyltransferase [Streptococcus equi]MCD3440655.1 GNAT family N-acetyltransferase [Streptococcus equi subsp. zooepidemicus]MCD3440663.1 GNAT family N-acetyltransferase [Streptococcus equi subsp. zooepidemicus]MCD3459255.1 GNAT family N-acetyltransferase [Streptococcus equi subsp. zooepidemicus]MDI5903333.1 GNAT family N-acetyltransferase [Streptococcus equi subsp. zooepidemicus]MDI5932078.1 GNAT family N-acetyltransferase [Streptococcus equi subsp. zooepidemicus]